MSLENATTFFFLCVRTPLLGFPDVDVKHTTACFSGSFGMKQPGQAYFKAS